MKIKMKEIKTVVYTCPKCGTELDIEPRKRRDSKMFKPFKSGGKRTLIHFGPDEISTMMNWTGTIAELANKLGRRQSSVYQKMKSLGKI